MNAAEIKIELFRKLDSLKENRLEEAYGILINFINGKTGIDEWQNLTIEQQNAIQHGLDQLNRGEGRKHSQVMSDLRNKYLND
jgi:predicted transcriptional regulator